VEAESSGYHAVSNVGKRQSGSDAAKKLGMSRVSLSRVLNGRAAISPDLAIRLELAG
jgi:plasmid maintenance system antidote protein VapI